MPLVPTIIRCCAHIVRLVCGRTDGRTDGQTKYSNPRCACAPRVTLHCTEVQTHYRTSAGVTDYDEILYYHERT